MGAGGCSSSGGPWAGPGSINLLFAAAAAFQGGQRNCFPGNWWLLAAGTRSSRRWLSVRQPVPASTRGGGGVLGMVTAPSPGRRACGGCQCPGRAAGPLVPAVDHGDGSQPGGGTLRDWPQDRHPAPVPRWGARGEDKGVGVPWGSRAGTLLSSSGWMGGAPGWAGLEKQMLWSAGCSQPLAPFQCPKLGGFRAGLVRMEWDGMRTLVGM